MYLPRMSPTPLRSALYAGLLLVALAFFLLSRAEFDASRFVGAGAKLSDSPYLTVVYADTGYDGQFYYRLALDPFTREQEAYGVKLDIPPYRQQRILYPLVAGTLALRNPRRVPAAMLAVNLLALCVVAWVGATLAVSRGRSALWGWAFALYPGFLVSLSRDLAEPLETALLLSSLLALHKGRGSLAAVLLTLAALTRETAAVVAVAALLVYLYRRTVPLRFALVPLIVVAIWQFFLFIWWGQFPFLSAPEATGLPFAGILTLPFPPGNAKETGLLAEISLVALLAAFAMSSVKGCTLEVTALSLFCMLVISLGRPVWVGDIAFLRALSELFCFALLVVLAGRREALVRVSAVACALLLAVFIL